MPPSLPTTQRLYSNPAAALWTVPASASSGLPSPITFHRSLPSYSSTPLHSLPSLATSLGLSHLLLKDESSRLSLPAFKILGASFAVFLALCARAGLDAEEAAWADLVAAVTKQEIVVTLHAATDGNHGRAVAHLAALLGLPSRIVVPSSVSERSRAFIASEKGAQVVVCDGSYDEAVAAAASAADEEGEGALLIQDTSFEGYYTVPRQIIEGYRTLFYELDSQLSSLAPSSSSLLIAVPVGVGSLAHAAILHYRSTPHPETYILAVEPTTAPCLLTSLLSGHSVPIATSNTIMAGLNCGTVSPLSFPSLLGGIDCAVSVDDAEVVEAMKNLDGDGVQAGPCGAAALAGLRRLLKERGGGTKDLTVVLICTEGPGVYGTVT